jgi:hypothetical protein
MPSRINDYPLSEAVTSSKRTRFLVIVFVVTSVLLASLPQTLLAAQAVSARAAAPCLQSAAATTLAPEWVAVRQQYERGYRPIMTHNPQTAIARVAALPPLAPEWVAVRQQYERSYVPIATDCIEPRTNCTSLAAEWMAVRQQYERSYVPPC